MEVILTGGMRAGRHSLLCWVLPSQRARIIRWIAAFQRADLQMIRVGFALTREAW